MTDKHAQTLNERFEILRLAPMRQTGKNGYMGSDVRLGETELNVHLLAIRRACYNHKALVETLETAIEDLNASIGEWQAVIRLHCPNDVVPIKDIIENLEEALTKAKEKS